MKLSLPASRLAYWNDQIDQWVIEQDQVEIIVGGSSTDARLRKTIGVDIFRNAARPGQLSQ